MNPVRLLTYFLTLTFLLGGCSGANPRPANAQRGPVPVLAVPASPDGLPVVENPTPDGSLKHDPSSFTQGLLYHQGKLYESTGRIGESKVRRLDPVSGQVELSSDLDPELFGEGLSVFEDQFYQLTWRAGVCLVYDPALELQKTLFYGTEGWGLTTDPNQNLFVFSDGSAELRFLDPSNLITKKKFTVTDGEGRAVNHLNELEWVDGEVWANVWTSDTIARIDPETGKVTGWIKLGNLVEENQVNHESVLNGIAYDPEKDVLWVTGKLWPQIYRFERVRERFKPLGTPRTGTPTPAR